MDAIETMFVFWVPVQCGCNYTVRKSNGIFSDFHGSLEIDELTQPSVSSNTVIIFLSSKTLSIIKGVWIKLSPVSTYFRVWSIDPHHLKKSIQQRKNNEIYLARLQLYVFLSAYFLFFFVTLLFFFLKRRKNGTYNPTENIKNFCL